MRFIETDVCVGSYYVSSSSEAIDYSLPLRPRFPSVSRLLFSDPLFLSFPSLPLSHVLPPSLSYFSPQAVGLARSMLVEIPFSLSLSLLPTLPVQLAPFSLRWVERGAHIKMCLGMAPATAAVQGPV